MDNKNKVFVFLLVILLISVGFFYFNDKKTQDIVETQNISKELGSSNTKKEIVKELEQASLLEQKKVEDDKIKEIENIKKFNQAGDLGDEKICDSIENESAKIKCQDNANASKAGIENDFKYCLKIKDESWKKECLDNYYYNDGIKKQDTVVCNKINDYFLKDDCLKSIVVK